jgi:hypothetical protein
MVIAVDAMTDGKSERRMENKTRFQILFYRSDSSDFAGSPGSGLVDALIRE